VTRASAIAVDQVRAHVCAADSLTRAGVLALLRQAQVPVTADYDWSAGIVVVAAASSVEGAVDACPPQCRLGKLPLLIVATTFSRSGALSAVRAGALAVLPAAEVTPAQLRAALQSAQAGDARLSYRMLLYLINGAAGPLGAGSPDAGHSAIAQVAGSTGLTAQQRAVLSLMAQGYSNAAIARALSCSEHTVKNVGYELMGRLQARNRAHAVARGFRAGLI
jgi:DNA-binding NarL/FixJ family response regulator